MKHKKNKLMSGKSKLEDKFADMLKSMNLNFERYFVFKKREYDFLLIDYNILIEVHGCFFHCCIKDGYKPKYKFQARNLINDQFKIRSVKMSNKYKLLIIWEHEINENKTLTIKKINEAINLCKQKLFG